MVAYPGGKSKKLTSLDFLTPFSFRGRVGDGARISIWPHPQPTQKRDGITRCLEASAW